MRTLNFEEPRPLGRGFSDTSQGSLRLRKSITSLDLALKGKDRALVRVQRTALPLLISATLAGCSFIPAYERPVLPVTEHFPVQPADGHADVINAANAPAETGWRNFFRDAQLQRLIALALENNRDLRVAIARVEEARALYGVQASELLPSVGVGAQGAINRLPRDMRAPGAGSMTRSYQAGLGITAFELDVFGRVRSLSQAAYQQYLASEAARRTVHIALVAQVAQAWFNLRATEQQFALALGTQQARQQFFDLVNLRFENGIAGALDVHQARSQLDSVRAELVQFKRLREQARHALQLLLGQAMPDELTTQSATRPIFDTRFNTAQTLANVPLNLPSSVLLQRPDIETAEHQLQAANASIGAARAAFFPNISLTGMLGFASSALGDLFGSGGRGYWSFQPGITAPIFSGGGLRSNLQVAEVRKEISVAQYERAIQAAFREVADSLAGEITFSEQLDALRQLERSASETLALAKLRYENGIDSFLQVQTAEIALFATQQQFIQVSLASLVNRVDLYKALGGGWLENSAAAADAAVQTADAARLSGDGAL